MKVSQLLEATFNTDEMVDFIYDKIYSDFFENVQSFKKGKNVDSKNLQIQNKEFWPDELTEGIKDSKFQEAIKLNPISLRAGVYPAGNLYSSKREEITISFNLELYEMLRRTVNHGESYDDMMNNIPDKYHNNVTNEFEGNKVKSSIAHEFSHWLGDTFHDRHLTRMMNKVADVNDNAPSKANKIFNRGKPDPYMADYEIDAVIHGIKQLKRTFGQAAWDAISFNNLFEYDPTLKSIKDNLKSIDKKHASEWLQSIIKRMSRENLLGQQMTGRISL